ncbi:RNA polymerase sigma factor (sigma-70 family) [Anaerobacterium chartisolvens]|uniref:RNA polymerase sigma factor (Sigma-70 family) n=1 Tax=Anaerobacterium chartisolvens TaxID=1297424 RepID=A0A369AIT3_9FIRM|nr:sigma-70 family RNA polymerase sigma factor [Anaerobacterium chartisolvens]RCX09081.1 RNA polymerase sigma factor (sigma-70 family) [Anaerobacterium chartisolvens]
MEYNKKFIKNYFSRNPKPEETFNAENFLENVYFITFTSYLKKTFFETKKRYFIREKAIKDKVTYIDSVDILSSDTIDPVEEMKTDIENSIEDPCLFKAVKSLTQKQRTVLYGYYINGKSEIEISKELKITRQAVNRIRNRTLNHFYSTWGEKKCLK